MSEIASSYPSKLGLSDTLSTLMLHGARSDLMRGAISGHRERRSDAIIDQQLYSAGQGAHSHQRSCLSAVVNCLPRSFLAREREVIFSYP